ncbi:MAG: hypothetical protein DMG95_07745, partial [Acidobacteria bacterium]
MVALLVIFVKSFRCASYFCGSAGGLLPRKRSVLLSMALVVASFIVVSARKIYEYAAAPDKDKESNFVFPYNSEQKKPTILIAEPKAPPITFKQTGGFTNDASHLNQTAIYGVINIKGEDDIRNALRYARENKLKITCAGQQHSMGGQTFTHGGLLLDLREFNRITLDKEHRIVKYSVGRTLVAITTIARRTGLVGQVHAVNQHLQCRRLSQRKRAWYRSNARADRSDGSFDA